MTSEIEQATPTAVERRFFALNSRVVYWSAALAVLVVFFAINFRSLGQFPTVWEDEVMQIDPAVNFAGGMGWCSRAWFSQSAHEFWAANNPLYPALLSVWIRVFGFGLTAIRSFNLFEYSIVVLILLSAANLIGLLRHTLSMLAFIFLLSCSGIMSFIYRSGRADITTMLVCSLVVWSFFYSRVSGRYAPLFLSTLLVSAAGIQSLPYLVALGSADWLISRGSLKPHIVALTGVTAGGAGLMMVMIAHRVLSAFISNTFASGYSIFGAALQYFAIHDSRAQKRLEAVLATMSPGNIWHAMTADAVMTGTLAVLIVLFVIAVSNRSFRIQSPLGAGLVLAAAIPLFMTASGRYADYYRWMSVAPQVLCTVAAIEGMRRSGWIVSACAACLAVGAVLGLPSELYGNYRDKDARDYSRVVRYLRKNVAPGAMIYGDSAAYYAAKNLGYNFYMINYGGGRLYPKLAEADSFSTLVINPADLPNMEAKVGGKWVEMPESLDTCSSVSPLTDLHGVRRCYNLSVYRRVH